MKHSNLCGLRAVGKTAKAIHWADKKIVLIEDMTHIRLNATIKL